MSSQAALAISGLFFVSALIDLLQVRPMGVMDWVSLITALGAPGLATLGMLRQLRRTTQPLCDDELRTFAANSSMFGYIAVGALARLIR
jgi:hypothetical protein